MPQLLNAQKSVPLHLNLNFNLQFRGVQNEFQMRNGSPPHLSANLHFNLQIKIPKRKLRSEMGLLNTLQRPFKPKETVYLATTSGRCSPRRLGRRTSPRGTAARRRAASWRGPTSWAVRRSSQVRRLYQLLTGWSIRLYTTFCRHQNKSSVTLLTPYTKTQLSI